MTKTLYAKIGISCVATIMVIAHLIWPALAIDTIAIVLVIIAVSPWLASIIESAAFPGGWEVVFREVKETVDSVC